MMLLVLAVISLLGSISEAQSDSTACIAATEALGNAMNGRCNNSVHRVSDGTYSRGQFDRACNEGPCRELWSDMIDACNPVSEHFELTVCNSFTNRLNAVLPTR